MQAHLLKTSRLHGSPFSIICLIVIIVCTAVGCDTGGSDDDETEQTSDLSGDKIVPSDAEDAESYMYFGVSTSISGDFAIVGASWADAAYIFQRSEAGWIETAKLTASDTDASDDFGQAVSISGSYAIVGANNEAYIYQYTGNDWVEVAKLTASDAIVGDDFGDAVSISGNFAVVGAPHRDDDGFSSGAVYLFENTDGNWAEVTKLKTGGSRDKLLGRSVSISDDHMIIGGSGLAFIFEYSGGDWVETEKLYVGGPVSITGDHALVGRNLFQRSDGDWILSQELTVTEGFEVENFGHRTSISSDFAVGSAQTAEYYAPTFGSVHVFKRTDGNWVEIAELFSGIVNDGFGHSLSVSGDDLIVGACSDNDHSGAAYLYDLSKLEL